MAEFINLDWEDLDGNIRQLELLSSQINSEMDRIMTQAGLILQAEIQTVITNQGLVDTGYMRMNWSTYVEKRFKGLFGGFETVAIVATNTEYAPYLNFGTGRIRAYKFVEIAWEKAEPKIVSFLQRELGQLGFGPG